MRGAGGRVRFLDGAGGGGNMPHRVRADLVDAAEHLLMPGGVASSFAAAPSSAIMRARGLRAATSHLGAPTVNDDDLQHLSTPYASPGGVIPPTETLISEHNHAGL